MERCEKQWCCLWFSTFSSDSIFIVQCLNSHHMCHNPPSDNSLGTSRNLGPKVCIVEGDCATTSIQVSVLLFLKFDITLQSIVNKHILL